MSLYNQYNSKNMPMEDSFVKKQILKYISFMKEVSIDIKKHRKVIKDISEISDDKYFSELPKLYNAYEALMPFFDKQMEVINYTMGVLDKDSLEHKEIYKEILDTKLDLQETISFSQNVINKVGRYLNK